MAKIKFDRLINITLNSSSSTIVPTDEVWRVTMFGSSITPYINGDSFKKPDYNVLVSSGAKLELRGGSSMTIQGIAFKVVKQ